MPTARDAVKTYRQRRGMEQAPGSENMRWYVMADGTVYTSAYHGGRLVRSGISRRDIGQYAYMEECRD